MKTGPKKADVRKWDLFLDYWKTPVVQELSRIGQVRLCLFIISVIGITTIVIDLLSGVPVGLLMLVAGSLIKAIGYTMGMIAAEIVISYFSRRKSPYSGISVGKTWVVSFLGFVTGFMLLEPYRHYLGHMEHHGGDGNIMFLLKIIPVWLLITYGFIQYHLKESLLQEVNQLQVINQHLQARSQPLTASSDETEAGQSRTQPETILFHPPGRKYDNSLDVGLISHVNVIEHYCYVHYKKESGMGQMEFKLPLKEIIRMLPASLFVHVHRSYLVNITHISKLSKTARSYQLFLADVPEPVPISRYRLSEVMPMLQPFAD